MRTNGPLAHRAGPIFGLVLVVVGIALAFTPVIPAAGAIDPTPTPSTDPTSSPVPSPGPTPVPSPDPTTDPSADPTPTPVPDPTAIPVPVDPSVRVSIASTAPATGRHRLDPGGRLVVTATARSTKAVANARLTLVVPAGWAVADPRGGTVAASGATVTWSLGDLRAGATVTRRAVLIAPALAAGADPSVATAIVARLRHAAGVSRDATLPVLVAPETIVARTTVARLDRTTDRPTYLGTDARLGRIQPLDTIRIRFQVRNADTLATTIVPELEYRYAGRGSFVRVREVEAAVGSEFYLASEWRTLPGSDRVVVAPAREPIATNQLRIGERDTATQQPAPGLRITAGAGSPTLRIPGDRRTEVEFSVRVTNDAPFESAFEFRLVDAGREIPGSAVVSVEIGPARPARLSPGQRRGIDVPVPPGARPPTRPTPAGATAATAGWSDVDFPLAPPDVIVAGWAEDSAGAGGEPRYQLAVAIPTGEGPSPAPAGPGDMNPHAPDTSLVSDTCAGCHSTHAAQGPALLIDAPPQSTMCFTCHAGTGSDLNVKAQYDAARTDDAVSENDPAAREYYEHPALEISDHVLTSLDEFGGVSNRHSACGDCHNPHIASTDPSVETPNGWTVSGRQTSVSGVSVSNGAAGTAPTYTFLGGAVGSKPTYEYEICLKCHSGSTVLPSNAGFTPARYALDKGVELNPANASYHPIERAGRNTSTAMANSLDRTSAFKQWDFTTSSTIRCTHCHGDPARFDATTPPAPGSDLAPHASANRGILLHNYRDRLLKPAGEAYVDDDFALCYMCHAEEPFVDGSSDATNFSRHASHMTSLRRAGGAGTDIDTDGAGQGNAICAECHFRTHGTTYATDGQPANARLVNFAPNVQPDRDGVLAWTPDASGGSCTLTCHGMEHRDRKYGGGPGPGGP
jgi:predicted CXXCH cytochrome family protein